MVDFATLAQVKLEDLPDVVLLPQGSYIWSIDRIPDMEKSKAGDSTNVRFRVKGVSAGDDVDEDELKKFGRIAGTIRTLQFNVPDEPKEEEDEGKFSNRQASALKRLTTFLRVHAGVEGEDLQEMMANCLNHQFLGIIVHKPSYRDKSVFAEEFNGTAPITE